MRSTYFIINKPYGMLSQFTREGKWNSLADLSFAFPKDVYPVGRLDADSEGLLILTNDKKLNSELLSPKKNHDRTYLVQLEGSVTPEAILSLQKGIKISINGKPHITLPSKVKIVDKPNWLNERIPAILEKRFPVTSWIELSISEGKNRQVRRMTAAVGYPTLRLVRIAIENISLTQVYPNEVLELTHNDMYRQLEL